MAEIGSLAVSLTMDASNFNGTIAQVDRNLKAMGGELQAVKAKGKDFGSSVEGLSQKQGILNRSFDTAGLKLQEQRKRYDELVASGKATDAQIERQAIAVNKAQTEYNRLEVELKSVTEQLKIQSSQWTQAGQKMQEIGGKLKTVGSNMTDIGKDLTMKVSAPIAALGVGAFKAAVDFESAFAGVRKTVDATEGEFQYLSDGIRKMAKEMPNAATEIAAVGEAAGQLGIEKENILGFTETMVKLGTATNMGSDEAATALARLANITKMNQADFDKLGSAIVALGNNFATTESEITEMGLRLAGAGAQIGLSEADILGLSAALTSVGIQAEMGGSAFSRVMVNMQMATSSTDKLQAILSTTGLSLRDLQMMASHSGKAFGNLAEDLGMTKKEFSALVSSGSDLENFGKIAGMTGQEFKQAFEKDAVGAIGAFVSGLGNAEEAGTTAINMLQEMGITEIQLRDALLRAGGAAELFGDAVKTSNEGWTENNALNKEAEERYKTTAAQLQILKNKIVDVAFSFGDTLIPMAQTAIDKLGGMVEKFSDLSPEAKKTIIAIGGIVAAAGPLLVIGGSIMSGVGGLVTTVGTLSTAIGSAGGLSVVLGGLGTKLAVLTGPIGWTALGIAAIGTAAVVVGKEMSESSIQIEDWSDKVSESTAKAVGGFMDLSDEASGHLTTLSITGQAVTKEMASNITSIFAQMGQQVLSEMQTSHSEQFAAISTFYANSNVLIESEEAEILAKTAKYHANKEKQITDGNARIAEIMNTASNEKRAITLAEQAEINRIHGTMKDNAIKYMTETELEQKVILEAMKNNASEISAQQAAEVVKNAINQKDKVIDEAEEQYKKAVAEIIKQRDEMGVISGQQAKQLIEDAGKQRDETIKAAQEMHTNVVSEAKKQAGEHVDQVEWETGEIKSKWQVMKEDITSRSKKIGSDVKRDWTQMYNDVTDRMKKIGTDVKNDWTEMYKSSTTWVGKMADSIDNKFQAMGKNVGIKMNEAKDTIVTKWNEAGAFLKAIDLKQIGRDIIDGLIGGIGEKLGGLKKKVEEIASNLPQWAKNILDIRSPSRVFAQIGKWISEGWAIGIEEKGNMVQNAVSDIALNAKDIAEHYVSEEKKLRSKANADIAKIETDKASKIAIIEKRMYEDVAKAQRSAASKKTKTTQDDALKIQRIREDAAAKIAKLEETSSAQIEKIRATSTKKIFDLDSEMNKTLLEETKRYIDDKKSLEQLSIIEEAQIWEQSMRLFAEGTKERVKAQQEYKKATETVNKEITTINADFQGQINKVNVELIKQEETLTKAYEDAVDKRAKSLYSFKNLFDEFKVEIDTTGNQLLVNLGTQVEGFKAWQRQIELLSEKAIDKGLLAELREMGPNALPQLIALNNMTSAQLTQYSNLYKEKSSLARKQAETEMIGMKNDTDKQITELRNAANKQLDSLEKEWNSKIKSLTKTTATELSNLKQIGRDAGQGLLDGLSSMEGQLEAKARSIANSISKTISSALQIKSPSRVMRGFGVNIGEGLVLGMDDMVSKVAGAAQRLATSVEGNMLVGNTSSIDKSRSYTNGDTHIYVYGNNPSPSEIARQNTQAQRQLAMEWGMA